MHASPNRLLRELPNVAIAVLLSLPSLALAQSQSPPSMDRSSAPIFGPPIRVQPDPIPRGDPAAAQSAAAAVQRALRVELSDRNLRRALTRWSKEQGRQLIWDVDRELEIVAEAGFSGSYESAIEQLLAGFARADMPLRACLYTNNVTRIVNRSSTCD